jgi:hypothetical protein
VVEQTVLGTDGQLRERHARASRLRSLHADALMADGVTLVRYRFENGIVGYRYPAFASPTGL